MDFHLAGRVAVIARAAKGIGATLLFGHAASCVTCEIVVDGGRMALNRTMPA